MIPAGGQSPRQPAGELALIGEANSPKASVKFLLHSDLHPPRWLCFSRSYRPSRVPEPCLATGPDWTVFPKPNCQIRPGANAPYEIIRHNGLKLPSFGKKNEERERILGMLPVIGKTRGSIRNTGCGTALSFR